MEDTSKYLIHADVTADGVVERSDVVGAIFGQTEGLLGDELDLRDLRQSQKVGRIDVEITSTQGQSHGNVTIATSLDKVETATLAASLETITRVGPCRATLDVSEIEDVRAAKRKEVVDRAKELLRTGFDDSVMSSEEILTEVRQHVRVEDITEYDGFPAGPRVTDSDAIIVVEGRSDVLTLLKYGVKNAIAVEGTNVPDPIADLTAHRTVTAFLDGDRGGDLILEELSQVGDVDYVAFAPSGTSVEELDHHQLFTALRNKVPYDTVSGLNEPREAIAATDGSTSPAPAPGLNSESPVESPRGTDTDTASNTTAEGTSHTSGPPSSAKAADAQNTAENALAEPTTATHPSTTEDDAETETHGTADTTTSSTPNTHAHARQPDSATADDQSLETVYEHATAIIRSNTDRVRFLDAENDIIAEADASSVGDELAELESVPTTIVLDGILSQQVLDLAADRGVERIITRSLGQFTKRPTSVQIHAVEDVASEPPE
ncbi:DNA primase DnaG [Natrialba taiwanensis]|uniref:DNA primase DnaG n=1 Tax=Natrialba taiwanensis DSM 12281 TaxID=1230458 RepID=M0AAU1_9EURY|nr:DNA primase DnaG [Natrialba taiwanensis]ELY94468.1 DNA primase [Natrialba taiwanensis DSM 12281]